MGKNNFNEVTTEVAVFHSTSKGKKQSCIGWFFPQPAPKDKFLQVIDEDKSKVKIQLVELSFSTKKKVDVYMNLKLDEVFELAENCKSVNLTEKAFVKQFTKVMGAYPEREGNFKGMCASRKMTIQFTPKTSSGEVMNYPWTIFISNGYAKCYKSNDLYQEVSSSFVETGQSRFRFTKAGMTNFWRKVQKGYETYLFYIRNTLTTEYFKEFEQKQNFKATGFDEKLSVNGGETNVLTDASVSYNYETGEIMNTAQPVQNANQAVQMQPMQPVQQQLRPEVHKITCCFTTDFQALSDGTAVVEILSKGKTFTCYFRTQEIAPEIFNAKQKGIPLDIYIYQGNDGRFWFYSLAEKAA